MPMYQKSKADLGGRTFYALLDITVSAGELDREVL